MLTELPKRLKSGRALVATAADRHVGLYGGAEDGYRVVTLAGRVYAGDGDTVPPPPEGTWRWLRERKARTKKRDREHERNEELAHRLTNGDASVTASGGVISITHRCIDCDRDVRERGHAHTLLNERGYPRTICCRCARRRGMSCLIHAKIIAARKERGEAAR